MTVERIALDSKVGAQGLVRALASDEACPYLPRAGMAQQCSSATQAHSPNMYSTCILAFQLIEAVLAAQNSIVANNTKWNNHFGCKEPAESGRPSGPLCMRVTWGP